MNPTCWDHSGMLSPDTSLPMMVHTFLTRTYFSRWASRAGTVLFISRRLCIKSAAFTTLAEAEAMRFIARNTAIPVPRVYIASEHRGRVYILMERKTGQDLSEGWLYRSQQSRDNILQNLKRLVDNYELFLARQTSEYQISVGDQFTTLDCQAAVMDIYRRSAHFILRFAMFVRQAVQR